VIPCQCSYRIGSLDFPVLSDYCVIHVITTAKGKFTSQDLHLLSGEARRSAQSAPEHRPRDI